MLWAADLDSAWLPIEGAAVHAAIPTPAQQRAQLQIEERGLPEADVAPDAAPGGGLRGHTGLVHRHKVYALAAVFHGGHIGRHPYGDAIIQLPMVGWPACA